MSSVHHLRQFISARLTAAAEEIFSEFEKTIVQYEEEVDRHRRLLDISWKPGRNFHTADLPQQHDCKDEEVLTDQQLLKQEMNSSLDQEEPGPPQIKEENKEVHISQEGEHLVLKDETDMEVQVKSEPEETLTDEEETDDQPRSLTIIMMKPKIRFHGTDASHHRICKEEDLTNQQLCNQKRSCSLDQNEPEPPQIKEELEQQSTDQEEDQLVLKQETETFLVTHEDSDQTEAEANSNQLFSHNSLLAELHVQEANRDVCSGSTIDTEQMMDSTDTSHNNNMANSFMSEGYHKNDKSKNPKKKSPMKKHCSEYTNEKPHSCNESGNYLMQEKDLTDHMKFHTGEKPYPCKACGKSFRSKTDLTKHTRTHTGEKPFSCKICGKSFRLSQELIRHTRTHTGEKPYSCKICGKSFRLSQDLTRHTRTHTGEKPYSCKICGKGFSQSSHVNDHMRTHTGEKPYSCKTCGKRFCQTQGLTKHTRTHTGERPYSCKICGKSFRLSHNLTRHTKTHTVEKPYHCKTWETFPSNSSFD